MRNTEICEQWWQAAVHCRPEQHSPWWSLLYRVTVAVWIDAIVIENFSLRQKGLA